LKRSSALTALVLGLLVVLMPAVGRAHPMGNFSVSHYGGIRILPAGIELRYFLDLAEIPTFQEIQDSGIVAEAGHASLGPYLAQRAETLRSALALELNGRRLELVTGARDVRFTPGVGGLPTMKLGIVYRASLDGARPSAVNRLTYRDGNFPDRAGWKEVVATATPGVLLSTSSVSDRDRSGELSDYPTDLLNSAPQVLEASISFALEPARTASGGLGAPAPPGGSPPGSDTQVPANPSPAQSDARADAPVKPLQLEPNRQAPRPDAFADLIATPEMNTGILLFAALVAVMLGALHALEPGHGKTVVAAYLVGSRGTATHALLLGLIVTASHTVGVYLLGAVTLYASRYVMPEQLYPWLGAGSGLIIAGLGVVLFLKRYAGRGDHHHGHAHAHGGQHVHGHSHAHDDAIDHSHSHDHQHTHDAATGHEHPHTHHGHPDDTAHGHAHVPAGPVSLRALCALGISGGIVPCPAALVVLLSAVALRRIGFGLFLIVAFSVGLAAVLIAIGLLMVYAGRVMARFHGHGRLVTRWLPLTSSAVITVLGIAIAAQALMAGGVLHVELG